MVKTGNVMVDAILNSKLSMAQAKGISVNAKATVSPELPVAQTDLCVILGNLLDNAMEACMKQAAQQERFIRVYIGRFKGQFYISVSNSVGGGAEKAKRRIPDHKSRQPWLRPQRVDALIEKYGGYRNRQDEGDVFATEVMLPIGSQKIGKIPFVHGAKPFVHDFLWAGSACYDAGKGGTQNAAENANKKNTRPGRIRFICLKRCGVGAKRIFSSPCFTSRRRSSRR